MTNTNTQIAAQASVFARAKSALQNLREDRRGVTTVEYIVLLAFVGLGVITAVTQLGQNISQKATELGGNVTSLTQYGGN